MIKAFISHSSKQKDFALKLVEELGRDFCMIDCYNFQPAYKTSNEIYRCIDASSFFVLLISKDALESDWVQREIGRIRNCKDRSKQSRFLPYIIDQNMELSDCPTWMKDDECYNLCKFKSPYALARDIDQKFRLLLWKNNPTRKFLDTIMVGRNRDIEKFENKYYDLNFRNLRALIVSGRNGVGKDTFSLQCMQKVGYPTETIPYRISLDRCSIEDFVVFLNLYVCRYTQTELFDILRKSPKEKAHVAVLLLNDLYATKTVVFVEDDLSCVLSNRQISEWLIDILQDKDLNCQLGLFIKSLRMPKTFIEDEIKEIAHIPLNELCKEDRRKIFVSCARAYGILDKITEEDVSFFSNKLLQSPLQIVQIVEQLSKYDSYAVKQDIDNFIKIGDNKISPLIEEFSDDEERYLLIILSKIDFVSYEILESVFGERIKEAMKTIYKMIGYGIVTVFGPSDHFFRLDHFVSDYIKRCRFLLPTDWECSLNEAIEKTIQSSNNITEDASAFLFDVKRQIMAGKSNHITNLFPSVVINSVMDVYNERKYVLVINICDTVLQDMHNYYKEVDYELRYWLCLALCRKQDERFFKEVKAIKSTNEAEYYFLRGFYARLGMKYEEAENLQKISIKKAPQLNRAKRELVSALLAQNKYGEALELAKENYSREPENSYQIYGYFRCLVRKNQLNWEEHKILQQLMDAMKDNYSDKHTELFTTMNIEHKILVEREQPNIILNLIKEAKLEFPNSVNVERVENFYKRKQEMIFEDKTFPEDC